MYVFSDWNTKHLYTFVAKFRRTVSHRDDRIGFAWPRHSLLQNPFATGAGGAGSTAKNLIQLQACVAHLTDVAIN